MRQCLGLFEAEKNRLMVFMIIFFSKIDAYVLTKTGNCSDVTQVSRARSLSLSLSLSLPLPPFHFHLTLFPFSLRFLEFQYQLQRCA